MRLEEIKRRINEANVNFKFTESDNNGVYYIKGIQTLRIAFSQMDSIGLIGDADRPFVDEILNTSSDYLSAGSSDHANRKALISRYRFLSNRMTEWINDYLPEEETETTIEIKLPVLSDFDSFEDLASELKKIIADTTDYIGEEVRITRLDYGSSWIIIDANTIKAAAFVFAVVRGGIYLYKEFLSIKKVIKEINVLELDEKIKDSIVKANEAIKEKKISEKASEIAESIEGVKEKNELLRRMEVSLRNLVSFIEKGGEILPSKKSSLSDGVEMEFALIGGVKSALLEKDGKTNIISNTKEEDDQGDNE